MSKLNNLFSTTSTTIYDSSEFMKFTIAVVVIAAIIVLLIALAICKCVKISYTESFCISLGCVIFIPGILTLVSGMLTCEPIYLFSGMTTIMSSSFIIHLRPKTEDANAVKENTTENISKEAAF